MLVRDVSRLHLYITCKIYIHVKFLARSRQRARQKRKNVIAIRAVNKI